MQPAPAPVPVPDASDAAAWKARFPEPVAILGYGLEGQSTLRHLRARGFRELIVLDRNAPSEPLPDGVAGVFGEGYLDALNAPLGDMPAPRTVFRAPGVRPLQPAVEAFAARGGVLTSQAEAALAFAGRNRVVGVTGTLGKGTCCSLLSAMLDAAGRPHVLAGNIGLPPLNGLEALRALPEHALLLLELSSFQLSTFRESPAYAIVLRVTTEHLDWHADRDEYWAHKGNLVRFQHPGDVRVCCADAEGSAWIARLGEGRTVTTGRAGTARIEEDHVSWKEKGLRIALADTRLTGAFNLENVAAAMAMAVELGVPADAIRAGAASFTSLEHRMEHVRTLGGLRFFNDSYATRPEAALAAVRAFKGTAASPPSPLGLILGGSEKFADFSELAEGLAGEDHLRAVAFIGFTAERLQRELDAAGALSGRAWKRCEGLEDAVEFLRANLPSGGVVLLSPACASFGLFANYKERGKAFRTLVASLD